MPSKQYLNPSTMPTPKGFTNVVKVDNTVYIAGQVGNGPDGSLVGKGDAEAQVRQIWRNMEAALQSVGGSRENIVKTTTYITSIEHMGAVRKVRDELHQSSNPPTSTLIVVAELASPDYLVEIEAIAVL